jgi:hypothetical protein
MSRIAVYCGANTGNDPKYITAARDLGKWLVANDHSLVYGGGGVGLMGILAKTVLMFDGRVTGIMPDNLSWIIHLGIGDMKSHLAGLKATFGALRILTERRSW